MIVVIKTERGTVSAQGVASLGRIVTRAVVSPDGPVVQRVDMFKVLIIHQMFTEVP